MTREFQPNWQKCSPAIDAWSFARAADVAPTSIGATSSRPVRVKTALTDVAHETFIPAIVLTSLQPIPYVSLTQKRRQKGR